MTATTFQADSFLNPTSLHRFLSGDSEALDIVRTPQASSLGRTWNDDSWLDTDELYYLATNFFLTIGSYILHAVCMYDLSKRVWVESRHAMANATAIKTAKVFRENLLSESINTHRIDTADYFLQPPARTTLATHPTAGSLRFFHQDGICRGMCHWFIHLYFKTRGRITDSDHHMAAIGKQFEQGASRQAAFLHSLDFPPMLDLLGLNVQTDLAKISTTGKTEERIIKEIQVRPPGVYGLYTTTHQLVYIKLDLDRQYLFDPNKGVVKVTSPDLFKKAMERYFETHDHTKEILLDRYSPR
ncbi:MAG: hypothetical protein JSS60_04000 [Verrucomicrobia bacterium]|nr:hypothetical protein [Verrucomicrobiota bacterium]